MRIQVLSFLFFALGTAISSAQDARIIEFKSGAFEFSNRHSEDGNLLVKYNADWQPDSQYLQTHILVIPDSVTYAGKRYATVGIRCNAFSGCKGLEEVVLPPTLKEIWEEAFADCVNLKLLNIPMQVKEIYEAITEGCVSLERITVDVHNTTYMSPMGCNAIVCRDDSSLIAGCSSTVIPPLVRRIEKRSFGNQYFMEKMTIPEGVEFIGTAAFAGCLSLKSVSFPQSLRILESKAFRDCRQLQSVFIPKNVHSIGNAFMECTSLRCVEVDKDNPYLDSRGHSNAVICKKDNALVMACSATRIPDSVEEIKDMPFFGNYGITSVHIPARVKKIDDWSFSFCPNLKKITVDSKNKTYDSREDCNCIIETATNKLLQGCSGSFIPSSVERIADGAFMGACLPTVFRVPDTVKQIDARAFLGCTHVEVLILPSTEMIRGKTVFNCCYSLRKVIFLKGKTISKDVFKDCPLLEQILYLEKDSKEM